MKRFKKNKLIVTSVVSILGVCGLVVVLNNVNTLMPQLANADDTAYRLNINTALTVDENNQATVKTTLGNDVVFEVEGDYTLDSGVITLKEGASLTNVNRIQGMSEITVNTDGKSLRMGLGLQADSMSLEEHYLLEDATVHMMNPTYDFVTLVATQDTTIESIDIGYSCVTRAVLEHGEDWIEIDSLDAYKTVMTTTNLEAKIYLSTNIDFNGEQLNSMPGEFKGTFDGNGYSVYNYLGTNDTNSRMFNLLNGATIQNVVISGTLPNSGGGTMVAYGAHENITNQSTISNTVVRANLDNGNYDGPYGMFVYLARNNNIRIENSHAELFFPATYTGLGALHVKAADGGNQTEVSNVTYGITGAGSEGKVVAGDVDGVTNTGKTVIHDPEVSITITSTNIKMGETASLTPSLDNLPVDTSAEDVTYTVTSDNTCLTVSEPVDGVYTLTGVSAGTAIVTVEATVGEDTYSGSVSVRVIDPNAPIHAINLETVILAYDGGVIGETVAVGDRRGQLCVWSETYTATFNRTTDGKGVELDFSNGASAPWYGLQIFYKIPAELNVAQGTNIKTKLVFESTFEGQITVNGTVCNVVNGSNTLNVDSVTPANAELSVQFGVNGGSTVAQGKVTFSAIEFYSR